MCVGPFCRAFHHSQRLHATGMPLALSTRPADSSSSAATGCACSASPYVPVQVLCWNGLHQATKGWCLVAGAGHAGVDQGEEGAGAGGGHWALYRQPGSGWAMATHAPKTTHMIMHSRPIKHRMQGPSSNCYMRTCHFALPLPAQLLLVLLGCLMLQSSPSPFIPCTVLRLQVLVQHCLYHARC